MLIPKKSKLEKAVCRDDAQPILVNPFFHRRPDGSGVLYASNKHAVVVVPVEDSEHDTVGPIPIEAVKAAQKAQCVLKAEAGYAVVPGGAAYPREDERFKEFPAIESLLVQGADCSVELALDAKTLYALAQTLGTDVVKLRVQANTSLPIGVEPHPAEPHIHGARAAIMPYRVV